MLFINNTGIHLSLPSTNIIYLLATSVELDILIPAQYPYIYVAVYHTATLLQILYSHMVSFQFDYRFCADKFEAVSAIFLSYYYMFMARMFIRSQHYLQYISIKLHHSEVNITCIAFPTVCRLLFSLFTFAIFLLLFFFIFLFIPYGAI